MKVEMSIEVSVVTPTYNRRKFIPTLIEIYKNQTYPKEKMEWIIIDDGRDKVEDLFIEAAKEIPNLRYLYLEDKVRIGAKRNLLNKEAKGAIIIAMDDDDYYPPNRVQTVVDAFKKYPRVDLAGSSEMYLYYLDTKKIYAVGPHHQNHATNGTMAWRKTYADKHVYDEYVTKSEEGSFLDNYKHKMIQLDPKRSILVICHEDNTSDKKVIRKEHAAWKDKDAPWLMRETSHILEDFVKEPSLRQFYQNL
jgi:glycosyltransferase involved in cell wall biosynthesis